MRAAQKHVLVTMFAQKDFISQEVEVPTLPRTSVRPMQLVDQKSRSSREELEPILYAALIDSMCQNFWPMFLGGVCAAVAAVVIFAPARRRLHALEQTAQRFGTGDLSVRAVDGGNVFAR